MSKQIKVSDSLHQRIQEGAKRNYRTISGHLEFMMDNHDKMLGSPPIITPSPKKPEVKDPEHIRSTRIPPLKPKTSFACPHGMPWLTCKVASCNIKGRNMGYG